MAAKDSSDKSKTSKTARVMNLLSKKQDAPLPEEASAADPAPAAPASAAPAASAPILTPLGAEAAVSDHIRSALENVLEEELTPRVPAPPAAEEVFPSFDPPVWEAAPALVEIEPDPEPEPVAFIPDPQQDPVPLPHSTGYTNVMQVLVEERAPKYVKMFGLCQCERCLEDVKALALNHLPPKYVVMDRGDMVPKLTFYEGKYSSDITAQLLQACKKVMERPHHDRP